MRKVGTISSAAGLIFLGVWMIINKSSPELGREVFKWWPAIIILLGVEILVQFSRRGEDIKPGANLIIIPVIIVFLIVNVTQEILYRISDNGRFNFDRFIRFVEDIDMDNYKAIETSKTLAPYGNKIYFSSDNARISIKKSVDNNIKIDAKVYIYKSEPEDKYEISEKKEVDGYNITLREPYIKRVEVDLYVPQNYNLDVKCDNVDIKGEKILTLGNVNIECDNANVNISSASSLSVNADNSNVNSTDVKTIRIKGDSCNANIDGNSEVINIQADNGRASIKNSICQDVNISLGNGIIDLKTRDKNISVNAKLEQGICKVDNEKRVNFGISKVIGTGEGKINVSVDHGAINIDSQE